MTHKGTLIEAREALDLFIHTHFYDRSLCEDMVKGRQAVARLDKLISDVPKGAIENLKTHQQQLDMDGVIVGVSRQALEELLEWQDAITEDKR